MRVGFWSILTLLLIALKLLGYIAIGWGWLVLIYLAPLIFVLLALGGLFMFAAVATPGGRINRGL